MTPVLVDPASCRPEDLEEAVRWLRAGNIVAFPTETFYGLAVDPRSASAVRAVFDLKGRPAGVALPLIAASRADVAAWSAPFSPLTVRLAEAFWPGPLSLLVDAVGRFAPGVAGADGSVAVRVPGHVVARALAQAFGGPLTATSANPSGRPPARRPRDLASLADDARVLVVDGGVTTGGAPSTIVDARGRTPTLVREGAVSWSRVLESVH